MSARVVVDHETWCIVATDLGYHSRCRLCAWESTTKDSKRAAQGAVAAHKCEPEQVVQ